MAANHPPDETWACAPVPNEVPGMSTASTAFGDLELACRIEPSMTEAVLHLSSLVGSPLLDSSGERLGRVDDLIARLDGREHLPPITGLKARIGGWEMFVPADRIAALEQTAARTSTTKLNLAQFERRPGEV